MKNQAAEFQQSELAYTCRVKCMSVEDLIDASTVGAMRRAINITLYFVSALDQLTMVVVEQGVNVDMTVTQDHVPQQLLAFLANIKDQGALTPYLIFDALEEDQSNTHLQVLKPILTTLQQFQTPVARPKALSRFKRMTIDTSVFDIAVQGALAIMMKVQGINLQQAFDQLQAKADASGGEVLDVHTSIVI